MQLKIVLYTWSYFQLIRIVSMESKCRHHLPELDQLVTGIKIDALPEHHRSRRSISSNIRIHFHYLDSFSNHPQSDDIIQQIMEPSKKGIEPFLKVKNPVNGILRVDRQCIQHKWKIGANGVTGCSRGCASVTKCSRIHVPDQYLNRCRTITNTGDVEYTGYDGYGITDVDIVLLVSYTLCSDATQATAASCFTEHQLDRPILGVIELCQGSIQANVKIKESIKVVQHEIIHALGFSVEKYAFYRYSDGTPIVPRNAIGFPTTNVEPNGKYYLWNDKIIKSVKRRRESVHGQYWKVFNAFVLENVVNAAREHFGCSSIDAVDLEDAGGIGSALTHFDEYFLFNEIMTPQTNYGIDVISKLTLALLKDTGWYDVDYSKAENLEYGKNKGCILPLQGCYRYIEYQRSRKRVLTPFCDRVLQFGNIARCSEKRNYFDFCHLTKYNEVFKDNQYFRKIPGVNDEDTEYYTGESEFNEYCPIKVTFTKPNSICNDIGNKKMKGRYNLIPSYYGVDSMCIENGLDNDPGNVFYGASCQKYISHPNQSLEIFFGSQSLICPSEKTYKFKINDAYTISVKCPENSSQISQISIYTIVFIFGVSYLLKFIK